MTFTPADERCMRLAIDMARKGAEHGQSPFGACIVRDDEVVACEHNAVLATMDSTAHAEVQAIRTACRALNTIDLSACTIYSTCEPCPMCFGACHWAKISRIVYGAGIDDALRLGFRQLTIASATLKELGRSQVVVVGGCLHDANLQLFEWWQQRADKRTY